MVNHYIKAGAVGYMYEFPDFTVPQFKIQSYNQRFLESNVIIDAASRQIFFGEHWGALSIKCAFNGAEHYRTSHAHYRVNDASFLIFNEGSHYSSWIDDMHRVESFTVNMNPTFEHEAAAVLMRTQKSLIDNPTLDTQGKVQFLECLYPHGGKVTTLMNRMRTLARDLTSSHLVLEEMFFELFLALVELQDRVHVRCDREYLSVPNRIELYQRLLRARDYIASCFEEDLLLSDVAHVACLNKFHLLRQFKKAFGITPHQYLTQTRLHAAAQKLTCTDEPVSGVCADVGFSDVASFSKLFKRTTGHSPANYRRLHCKQAG